VGLQEVLAISSVREHRGLRPFEGSLVVSRPVVADAVMPVASPSLCRSSRWKVPPDPGDFLSKR